MAKASAVLVMSTSFAAAVRSRRRSAGLDAARAEVDFGDECARLIGFRKVTTRLCVSDERNRCALGHTAGQVLEHLLPLC